MKGKKSLSFIFIVSLCFDCIKTDAKVSINPSKEYQEITGFGGINLPEWVGSDMTEAQVQKAFGNGDDELGFTILRIFINDNKNQWTKAVPTAKSAIKKGAIVFASPWNPPASMSENFAKGKRLNHNKYADYAQHLNSYIDFMKNNGVDLYAISVQNEPDYAHDWTWWTEQEIVNFLENYGNTIKCKLMAPESFQYVKSYYNAILASSKAKQNLDIWATHFYGTQRNGMDFAAVENSGKPLWMTEVYVPNSEANSNDRWPEALKVSENIHNGLVVANLSAYVWWYIRRNYGPLKENGTISKRGYNMAQFSKFIRPGFKRIDCTEQPESNILVSAYTDGKKVVIVAINKGSAAVVDNFSIAGKTISNVDRYRTSANENLAPSLGLEISNNAFSAQLPGQSVSTFVVT